MQTAPLQFLEKKRLPTGFGPSSAHRWMVCTGSLLMGDAPLPSSKYADRGTLIHDLASAMMESKILDTPIFPWGQYQGTDEWDEARACVLSALEYIENTRKERSHRPKWEIELRAPIDLGDGWQTTGRPDLIGRDATGIHVIDYKSGRVGVAAKDNWQLMLYALGAWQRLKRTFKKPQQVEMRLAVVQPLLHCEPRVWKVGFAEMKQRLDELMSGWWHFLEAPEKNAVFKPSFDRCRYCPSIHHCEAAAKLIESTAQEDTMKLKPDQLAQHRENCKLAAVSLEALDTRLKQEYQETETLPPGMEAVWRNKARAWENEKDKKLQKLIGHLSVSKLPSPAKLAKADKDLYEKAKGFLKAATQIVSIRNSKEDTDD